MNREEIDQLARVAERGMKILNDGGAVVSRLDMMMDLEFCHNDIPLDFEKLEGFDNGDFGHDITGIYRHFNRRTRKLEDCFVPRCAIREGGHS